MIRLILERKYYSNKQTLGTLEVQKDNIFQFSLATIEQEWRYNMTSNSCIPAKEYGVSKYTSSKHGECLIVEGTEPRTGILIHKGNFSEQSEGCIIVGLTHSDINLDQSMDVKHSSEALEKLMAIVENESIIFITIK